MNLLDYKSEPTARSVSGGSSRLLLFEQEHYLNEPTTAELIRVADPGNATPANRPGWYQYQLGLNPESELGIQPNFIENPALSGNLTAQAGKSGRQSILGTLNFPMTRAMGVLARHILQSRNTTDGTITRSPATITGTGHDYGKLSADVFATAPALQPGSTKTINSAFNTALTAKSYPVQLEVEITAQDIADVPATSRHGGVITITGTDHWDNEISDTAIVPRVTADDTNKGRATGDAIKVAHYWKTITSVVTSGFAATTGGTFQIKAYDTAQTVTFKPYDGFMVSYLLAAMAVGDVPRFVRGLYASTAQIVVTGPDALVEVRIGVGGRRGYLRQRPTPDYFLNSGTPVYKATDGTFTPAHDSNNANHGPIIPQALPDITAGSSDAEKQALADTDYRLRKPDAVEIISDPVMDTNRVELAIGTTGIRLPIRSLTADFGIQFEESGTITVPEENPQPGRRSRTPTMSGEYTYYKSDGLDVQAINNIIADFLVVTFSEKGRGAFPDEHKVTWRKTQLQEIGTPRAVEGEIGVAYSMSGLPSQGGIADDITYEMTVPFYQDVRNYT